MHMNNSDDYDNADTLAIKFYMPIHCATLISSKYILRILWLGIAYKYMHICVYTYPLVMYDLNHLRMIGGHNHLLVAPVDRVFRKISLTAF